ncbi:proline-rich protein 11-like [Dysidea avara]|uniref:proline-rich protein 11-like n=1 Tax=Dysidea avara TaxID=196820 RepID=UPI00331CC0ED
MTKSNSLRSLKKRRRSVSSVRKKEKRFEKPSDFSSSCQPEELSSESREEATETRTEGSLERKLQNDQEGEWFSWWNGSTLNDCYSWCQSSVKEGVEAFKDTVFPTRVLRRELTVVTKQLKQMEQEMERMRGGVHYTDSFADSGLHVPVAAPPPPVAPPPPPIAPPPAPVVFTNRSAANSKQANKQATAESKRPMVTLQDIQNVRLRTVTTTERKAERVKSPEGLVRAGLKRRCYQQQENHFHCSPKLLVNTRKKLKTTGINRTPGGTPVITTSHDPALKQTNNK